MNHPTREELSQFLYQELPRQQHAEISAHVKLCPDCRAQVEAWRAVRTQLAAWKIPAQRRSPVTWPSLARGFGLRWATAAAVLILAGYLLARFTDHPSPDSNAIRAAIAAEVRQELRAELAQFTDAEAQGQAEFRESLVKTLTRLETQRLVDYASLRRDLETVAIHAQDEFISTRQTLASIEHKQPQN